MKRPQNFDELLDIAKKRPDVHGALSQLGVSLKRVGYSMGGVRWQIETKSGTSGDRSAIVFIEKSDGSWNICDNKSRTGQQFIDAITLLREIFHVSFDDAVYMLSGGRPSAPIANPKPLTLERKIEPQEKPTYTPPTPADDKIKNVMAYLIQTRKLPKELVIPLIESGKIYASYYENPETHKQTLMCAFKITDENGNDVGCDSCAPQLNFKFKHLFTGSNADYAWCFPYEVEEITSETPIFFCEAPIDTMSLCALSGTPGVYVSMAGLKDRTFKSIAEKLGGKPFICVDNDEAGDKFAARHPDVPRMVAPNGKDWNDTLKHFVENGMSYAYAPPEAAATPDAAAAPDVPLDDNVVGGHVVHLESEDVDPKKENGALDKGASIQDKAITMDMPEEERTEILRNKTITPCSIEIHEDFNIDWEALEKNKWSLIRSPLVNKMRELGFLREYKTDNVDISFSFTGESLKKSMHSQVADYGGSLVDLSKVVMNMQRLLDTSVLIEIHSDKAKGSSRENPRLMQTYVLLSAFKENGSITPVQFEIKQYINNDNRLYLAVALTKREEDVISDTALQNGERTRLVSPSMYSIADFIEKINPQDENFFKYIPNSFLNEEQKQAKANALAREAKKYGRSLTEEKPDNPPLNDEAPIGAENVDKHSQDELRATLEAKVADVVNNYRADPRALAEYVLFSSRFNNYSANNLRLIWAQYPHAQYVTSAYDFSHGLPGKDGKPTVSEKIFIKKGERALRIWKPYDVKYTVMPDGTEKRSAWLTKSEREQAKAEKWKELTRKYFTLVPVFDITQTTASPDVYPKLCGFGGTKGTSADARFNALKNYCENVLNCPVKVRDFGERKATVRGSYYPDLNEIHISDMLEGENKLSTFIHELGHATLHADSYKNATKSEACIETAADMYAFLIEYKLGIEPTDARCRHLKAHYDEYLKEIKATDINADNELFNDVIDHFREQIPLIDAYVDNLNVNETQTDTLNNAQDLPQEQQRTTPQKL